MALSRRKANLGLACSLSSTALFAIAPSAIAQQQPRRCNPGDPPDWRKFEAGDFLWPKLPGTYVPFRSGSSAGAAEEKAEWMRRRADLVGRLAAEGSSSATALAAELRNMTFEQFHARYVNGARPGENVPFKGGQVGTGHIAILEIDGSHRPYVIEAMPAVGVQRVAYDDWLKARICEMVWHGRMGGLAPDKRASVATEAARHLGRPYDFWNLRLDDTSSFYCSKLVWLAVREATGLAIDGDSSPGPRFWVSPKRLLSARGIVKLYNPQDYYHR